MKDWIPAAVMLPTIDENGEKVLLYRTMNDQQQSMAVSIHDTAKVKYCQLDETWWMQLPAPPSDVDQLEKIDGSNLQIGDIIRIQWDDKTIADHQITNSDELSFAILNSFYCRSWFYRDTLNPYAGNAKIIGVVKDSKNG